MFPYWNIYGFCSCLDWAKEWHLSYLMKCIQGKHSKCGLSPQKSLLDILFHLKYTAGIYKMKLNLDSSSTRNSEMKDHLVNGNTMGILFNNCMHNQNLWKVAETQTVCTLKQSDLHCPLESKVHFCPCLLSLQQWVI